MSSPPSTITDPSRSHLEEVVHKAFFPISVTADFKEVIEDTEDTTTIRNNIIKPDTENESSDSEISEVATSFDQQLCFNTLLPDSKYIF